MLPIAHHFRIDTVSAIKLLKNIGTKRLTGSYMDLKEHIKSASDSFFCTALLLFSKTNTNPVRTLKLKFFRYKRPMTFNLRPQCIVLQKPR